VRRSDETVCPSVVLRFDDRTRLRLTAFLSDAMVGITTPDWPPLPVALIDWHSGAVRCAFEKDFAGPLGELGPVLADEAVALYTSYPGGMATSPLEAEQLPATLQLRGIELTFICDLDQARVQVTAKGQARPYVGVVRGVDRDDSSTQFWLHHTWREVFGDSRGRTVIRRCAIRRWLVEDRARRRSLAPVAVPARGAGS